VYQNRAGAPRPLGRRFESYLGSHLILDCLFPSFIHWYYDIIEAKKGGDAITALFMSSCFLSRAQKTTITWTAAFLFLDYPLSYFW